MSERYIAVDAGKHTCKVGVYDESTDQTKIFSFRTKTGVGYFDDDQLEKNTIIAEVDGSIYKIGNGACTEAELETSKMSEIHQICVLTAIALCCNANEKNEVNVAVGIPISDYNIVPKRNAYRAFILPEGEHRVVLKTKSAAKPTAITFVIKNRYVFPESVGALFLDKGEEYADGIVGVMDMGSLNNNLSVFRAGEMDKEMSLTDELGGNILIDGLARTLSSEFSRVDSKTITDILTTLPQNERCLNCKDEQEMARSNQMIHDYLIDHLKKIRRDCDTKQWPFEFIQLVAIGGTASVMANELQEVFGEDIYIPKCPQFANVVGFLRMCYAKCGTKQDYIIPMPKAMQIGPADI